MTIGASRKSLESKWQLRTRHHSHEVCGLRLQGYDATSTENLWIGLSRFLPGDGAEGSATPFKKAYVVTEGEVTISTDVDEQVLGQMDSCVIAADELRSVVNNTNRVVTMPVDGLTRP